MSHEILTLQFGHYANYICAHWWNLQECSFEYNASTPSEIDHGTLYREGLTDKGQVTFTPRMLLVDLKDSLNVLPESGGFLYDGYTNVNGNSSSDCTLQDDENYSQETIVIETSNTSAQKNEFQRDLSSNPSCIFTKNYNMEKDVNVWSDYLYAQYHPKTINIIKDYRHGDKQSQFDLFPQGLRLWESSYDFREEFNDKIRNYVEECDNFQGFQMLADATNGFGGLSASCLEYIRDDYERKSVITFPVFPSFYSDYLYESEEEKQISLVKDCERVLSTVLYFDALNEHSSLFVPLCTNQNGWRQPGPKREFYHTAYNHQLPYHTSAILASALDTLTLNYRTKSTQCFLSDLCADFNRHGCKAAATSLCLPFSFNAGADFIDCLNNWEGPLTQSITPNCSIDTDNVTQLFTLRGIQEDRLKQPSHTAKLQKDLPAYKCGNVREMFKFYIDCNYFMSLSAVTTVNKGLAVRTPYPRIFDSRINIHGNVDNVSRPENAFVDSVPVLAGLHTGKFISGMLDSLLNESSRLKFDRFVKFSTNGISKDEFKESVENLCSLRDCYQDDFLI